MSKQRTGKISCDISTLKNPAFIKINSFEDIAHNVNKQNGAYFIVLILLHIYWKRTRRKCANISSFYLIN